MHSSLKIFLIALLISFLGSLPLGVMNVGAVHIAVQDGLSAAFIFSAGAVLIEMIYVRIGLVAMDWIFSHHRLLKFFEWITVLLLFALAIGSIIAAFRKSGFGGAFPVHDAHPFILGILLSATNPMHISFWFGWSSILKNKQILLPQHGGYNIYVAAVGIGSILGFSVFIFGGSFLVNKLNTNQHILNWVIGGILMITAIIQLYKTIRKPLVPAGRASESENLLL
ncbi:MAG TPA: LysE family transporter [Puia sp.]|nr:LysE family transporter [Puia sp.]